jgi:hypothetical protein
MRWKASYLPGLSVTIELLDVGQECTELLI